MAWAMLVPVVVLIVIALTRFNLTALPEPGPAETRLANFSKRYFIYRASRHGIPPRPQDTKASIERGGSHYGFDCSVCHADDGQSQRTPGLWMYPRASDLTSKQVQSYSDQELFWIIQNGIRYTGMPAFGKAETPEHIWDLVNYMRTLPGDPQNGDSTKWRKLGMNFETVLRRRLDRLEISGGLVRISAVYLRVICLSWCRYSVTNELPRAVAKALPVYPPRQYGGIFGPWQSHCNSSVA
jgi:mono/diheme cytochrome c family protein